MKRSYRYRLFTNANQDRELAIMLETHRRLYNIALDYKQMAYECCGASISYVDISRWFKHQRETNQFFARLNYSSAEQTKSRLSV